MLLILLELSDYCAKTFKILENLHGLIDDLHNTNNSPYDLEARHLFIHTRCDLVDTWQAAPSFRPFDMRDKYESRV